MVSGNIKGFLQGTALIVIVALVILLVVVFFVLYPLLLIWAINQLFNLHVAYTFWNWVAALVIVFMLGGHKAASVAKNAIDKRQSSLR